MRTIEKPSYSHILHDIGDPSKVPHQPLRWPWTVQGELPGINVQVRQLQTSSQPVQVVTQLPVQTINQPKPVTGVFLNIRKAIGTRTVNVSFLMNPSDPNFQKANIYLRLGVDKPVLLGSGTTSPIAIAVPPTHKPATIFVQAEGNWGPHPLQNSPSQSVSLV